VDHWFKNVFMVPGIIAAIGVDREHVPPDLIWHGLAGLAAAYLVASSNCTICEMADAPFDRWQPVKHRRPATAGQISQPLGYLQWILLMLLGVGLGLTVSLPFAATLLVACVVRALARLGLLVIDLPILPQIFVPTAPTAQFQLPSPGP
jgi:4-hydroxybenzoate polyprenyltransferase